MMNGLRFSVAALSTLVLNPAWAHSGSLEDQMACTPDVYRFCSSQIPDEDKIVACLVRNRANLSVACGKVFSHGNEQPPAGSDSDDDQ